MNSKFSNIMIDHINTAFPEGKRSMMYKMMKWWGGKPHNIWSEYLETYSKKGDVVLDPFCGRGVGVIESVKLGRKAIGVDLNPIAIFQTKMIATHLDIDQFEKEWNDVKKELQQIENACGFFNTKCIKCKKQARIGTVNRKDDTPYEIVYYCTCSKKSLTKSIDDQDLQTIKDSNHVEITTPYPKDKFLNSDISSIAIKNYGETYDSLFSKRNLYALSMIFDRINKIIDPDIKSAFQFGFISMVHLASRIPSVRKTRKTSGSWGRPGFLKMKNRMEMNPFLLFERAIENKQGIIVGKKESNERLQKKIKFAKNQEELNEDKTLLLLQKNTMELTEYIKENSIDYVITDPPYGGLIAYFELSSIWSTWLKLANPKFKMPFDDEITIDKKRKLNFDEYHRRMGLAFTQIYKVLKEEKYMTVTFHNDQPKIFNSILSACQDCGFVLEKILFQMNRRAGETGAATPWGTSVSDFYIRFQKPKQTQRIKHLDSFLSEKFENIVQRVSKEIICERGEPTEIAAMIPHIYNDMGKSGMRIDFSGNDQISSILESAPDFVKKQGGRWWLSDDVRRKSNMQVPLSERVEESVISALRQDYKVSYDEILKIIFIKFPNSLTPNTENVMGYLKEYGTKTTDGKWRLTPGMSQEETTRDHIAMEVLLCKIGKILGYDVYSPDRNQSSEMSTVCVDFNLDVENIDRIKKMDVLWLKNSKIKRVFEVENSTSITSALERGSNIKDDNVSKTIVIPDQRLNFFKRKMKEPMFQDYFQKDGWGVLLYDSLTGFASKSNKSESSFLSMMNQTTNN